MTGSLSNIKKGSLVYKFITAGKPGNCKFCHAFVEKLEAHHICYAPEITIKLCHSCHHRVHFWPQRLKQEEIMQMLKIKFHHQTALKIFKLYGQNISELSKLIAPSRSKFVRKQQKLGIVRLQDLKKRGDKKLFKGHILNKSKSLSKKVGRH